MAWTRNRYRSWWKTGAGKHGGTFVRVHTCRLARYPSDCNKNISSAHDPCDSKTEDETSGEKDSDDSDDDEMEKAPLTNGENIATLDVTEPDVVENIEINNIVGIIIIIYNNNT